MSEIWKALERVFEAMTMAVIPTVLILVAASPFVCALIGIWLPDDRWLATAAVLAVPAIVSIRVIVDEF